MIVATYAEALDIIGVDEAVPSDAFQFRFDDEECLISYWVPVGEARQIVHTQRGAARLAAIENSGISTPSRPKSATGLLATDYALDDYTTWK